MVKKETAIDAIVEEDINPHINLQGNGVSQPTTPKKNKIRPFLLSLLLKTLEAARMQCSSAVNIAMLRARVD